MNWRPAFAQISRFPLPHRNAQPKSSNIVTANVSPSEKMIAAPKPHDSAQPPLVTKPEVPSPKSVVLSLAKGFRILEVFDGQHLEMGLSQIAQRVARELTRLEPVLERGGPWAVAGREGDQTLAQIAGRGDTEVAAQTSG